MKNYRRYITKAFFTLLLIIFYSISPAKALDKGIYYGDFAVTELVYSESSDWDLKVQEIFGSGYRVADWYDLKYFYNSGGDLLELFDGLGLTEYDDKAWLKRDGDPSFNDSRFYSAARHEGHLPVDYVYLAHDNIGNYILSLGSYFGTKKILAVKTSFETVREKDNGIYYKEYAVTELVYGETNWDQKVQEIFGSGYRVADWYDLKYYYNSGGDLLELFDGLNLTEYDDKAWLKRDGDPSFNELRFYSAARHEGHLPVDYVYWAHDNIGNYILSLGSFYGTKKILAIKTSGSEQEVPILTGIWEGSLTATQTNCLYGEYNGDFEGSVTLTIESQDGQNFSGKYTVFFSGVNSGIREEGVVEGTITADGSIEASISFKNFFGNELDTNGNATAQGTLTNDTLNLYYNFHDYIDPATGIGDTCTGNGQIAVLKSSETQNAPDPVTNTAPIIGGGGGGGGCFISTATVGQSFD